MSTVGVATCFNDYCVQHNTPSSILHSLISLSYTVDSRDPLFRDAIRLPLLDKDEAGSTSTGGCVRSVCVSELADKSKDELQGEPS